MARIADTVIDVYRRHGLAWSKLRGNTLNEATWLDRFCALLPARADILDIGCGSGLPIARELTRLGFVVTGVDAAPGMLALFQANVPNRPSVLSDMRELSLGTTFAGLLAWDSFFHLSPGDQRAMFPRFRDHAADGAALMFTSGTTEGEAIGVLQGDPLYHGSLAPAEYRSLLDAAGFAVVDHIAEDPTCGYRTVWLARRRR
jgi:SAM-dependent methyltransferase